MEETHIVVVGAEPRGTSCLEHLCSSESNCDVYQGKLTIHVVDPYLLGPGMMCYLGCAYGEICKRAREETAIVNIREYRASAFRLETTSGSDDRQRLTLSTNETLPRLYVVILAQSHVPRLPDEAERFFLDNVVANPSLHAISPGKAVHVRGLGLVFFDCMSLLASGRGGRLEPSDTGFTYHPSGKETKIYASSSRGVPHHARDDNEKGTFSRHKPLFLTKKVISPSNQRAGSDNASRFKEEIWPLISKEIKSVYYKALFEKKKLEDRDKFWEDVKQGVKNFTKYGQNFLIDRQRFKEDLEKFIRELDEDSSEAAKLQSLGVLEPAWSWRRLPNP